MRNALSLPLKGSMGVIRMLFLCFVVSVLYVPVAIGQSKPVGVEQTKQPSSFAEQTLVESSLFDVPLSWVFSNALAQTSPSATLPVPPTASEGQTWWQVLVSTTLNFSFMVGTPVLITLVVVLLRRWNIGVEASQVEAIAKQASAWAEHKAQAALKKGSPKTPGGEKMSLALGFAESMIKHYKLPEMAADKLKQLIEAGLAKKEDPAKAAAAPTALNTQTQPDKPTPPPLPKV